MYEEYHCFDYLYPNIFLEYIDYLRINSDKYKIINTKSYVILNILEEKFKFTTINEFIIFIKESNINLYNDSLIEKLFNELCYELSNKGILTFEEKQMIIEKIFYIKKLLKIEYKNIIINRYDIITEETKNNFTNILNELYINIVIIYIDKKNFLNKKHNKILENINIKYIMEDDIINRYIKKTIIYKEYNKLDLYEISGFIDTCMIKYLFYTNKHRAYKIIKRELYNYDYEDLFKVLMKINYNQYNKADDLINDLKCYCKNILINNLKNYDEKKILYNKFLNIKSKLKNIIKNILILIKNNKLDDIILIFYPLKIYMKSIINYLNLIYECNTINFDMSIQKCSINYINYKFNKNDLENQIYWESVTEWEKQNIKDKFEIRFHINDNEIGYLYIILEREFFRFKEYVFKIGCTKDYKKRFAQYPKGSIVIF